MMQSAIPLRPMLQHDAASEWLGMRLVADEPGRAVVELAVRAEHLNGHGITHGGIVFALADTAFAIACNEDEFVTVAAGADVTFLRSTSLGDVLTATAVRRIRSGRTGLYDVTVTDAAGEVVAEFRGRSFRTARTLDS